MNLKEILGILQDVADSNHLSTPYIVGGVPRNILLEKFDSLNDIDITTGNDDVHKLADLFARRLHVTPKIFNDGHRRIYVDNFQIDFSSHAIYDNIEKLIPDIDQPTNIVKDSYSRDFTVNSLLIPLDFSTIIDPTGMGIDDIFNKKLRCPVDCNVVFRESPNRIIRAFYYAAKYNLEIADEVMKAIKNNLDLLDSVNSKYSSRKITETLRLDPDMIDILIESGVLKHIPLTKSIVNLLTSQKKLNMVI